MSRLDLLTFHGINNHLQLEQAIDCMPEAEQMQKEGLVDHIGFSTHGDTALILDVIATDLFDYVNIHYHFCGMC